MTDLAGIADQFAEIVEKKLDERVDATAQAEAQAKLVSAILAKPILSLPDDLQHIAGCKKSTAYKIIQHPAFPATFVLGRQKFCATSDFMDALRKIGGQS